MWVILELEYREDLGEYETFPVVYGPFASEEEANEVESSTSWKEGNRVHNTRVARVEEAK